MAETTVSTGYRPHGYQAEIHGKLRRFSVLVCHRRFGKTVLAVNALVDAALRFTGDDGRFAYVAPYLKQARMIAWLYLLRYGRVVPGAKVSESGHFLEFPNGARITLYGADNAEALRGIFLDGVVLDEVADMRPHVWGEILRPALADRKGWGLFIGTPKGINLFHELYQYALSDPKWYAALFRADETDLPWLGEEELALAKATMSEAQYRQEFLCDFAASSDNTLITIDLVSKAAARVKTEREVRGLPRIIGVDVARFGGDRSVIFKRRGLAAFNPRVLQGLDNMLLAGLVAQEIDEWGPDAVFIDAGRGEGVIDRLRQIGHAVIEVNFGGRPINPRYANKRAEMWDLMRQWLDQGGAIPNDSALKTDLATPTYSFDAANRMVLEGKEQIKGRGLKSPDLADALALTFAMPVGRQQGAGTSNIKTDYNPYA